MLVCETHAVSTWSPFPTVIREGSAFITEHLIAWAGLEDRFCSSALWCTHLTSLLHLSPGLCGFVQQIYLPYALTPASEHSVPCPSSEAEPPAYLKACLFWTAVYSTFQTFSFLLVVSGFYPGAKISSLRYSLFKKWGGALLLLTEAIDHSLLMIKQFIQQM